MENLYPITCIKNIKKLENGGLESLYLTIGKVYSAWRFEDKKYLLCDDGGEKNNPPDAGEWYDESYFLPFTLEDITQITGVHHLKVKNVYVYGSRIYGTSREGSDYDIIFVASHLLEHEEKRATINGVLLNIHIITPDKFLSDLKAHNIMNLECLFAPGWAKLKEKLELPKDINIKKLIKNNLAQSYSSWQGGKMKIQKYDIHRGIKSIFHSLRMLHFAIQIAEQGKIVDFTAANHLFNDIVDSDEFEWDYFKTTYLPMKIELEDKLKSCLPNEQNS